MIRLPYQLDGKFTRRYLDDPMYPSGMIDGVIMAFTAYIKEEIHNAIIVCGDDGHFYVESDDLEALTEFKLKYL